MAQLFLKYGTVNSGKSIEVFKVAHNYEEQGKKIMLFTAGVDDRTGVGTIYARPGWQRDAVPVFDETNIFEIVNIEEFKPDCVIVDEVQFLKKKHVKELRKIVDVLGIPTMGFGLKNDFRNEPFEGSLYMFLYAEKNDELKTVCWFCNKKATMNLRVNNGVPVYDGEQIEIGDIGKYYPTCPKCYENPLLGSCNEQEKQS